MIILTGVLGIVLGAGITAIIMADRYKTGVVAGYHYSQGFMAFKGNRDKIQQIIDEHYGMG